MARITIEDCLQYIPNHFELAVLAGYRVRALLSGAKPLIDCHDIETVIALREIASGLVDVEELRRNAITKQHGSVTTEEARNDAFRFFSESDLDLSSDQDGSESDEEGEVNINFGIFSDQNLDVED